MMEPEITGYLGKLGLPAAMTLVMALIYKVVGESLPDRTKTFLVVGVGIILSIIWIAYSGMALTFVSVVDCFFYGIQLGATSIGLFKVAQAAGVFSPPGK